MIAQELGRRPRRFGRGPVYIPTIYYGYAYPPPEIGPSVEEEVAAIEARRECVVLREGYGPWFLRRVVVDALKGRGWVERARERGTLLLCPPPAMSEAAVRPSMVKGLGQILHGGPAVTVAEGVAAGVGVGLTILGVILRSVDGIAGDVSIAVGSSIVAASVFSAVSRRF